MTIRPISRRELISAQLALLVALALQISVVALNESHRYGQHAAIVATELVLIVTLAISARRHGHRLQRLYKGISVSLLGLISFENIISFLLVAHLLIIGGPVLSGRELLLSALAIFATNIIIFALWYWEIDSPGFSGRKWSRHDRDFLFPQQENPRDFPDWQPGFVDYMYLSITNAINFAPGDAKPITHQSKILMGVQALLSVFTLALILARSISILR